MTARDGRMVDFENLWTGLISLRWMGRYGEMPVVRYFAATVLVVAGAGLATVLAGFFTVPDVAIAFLPTVLLSAILWGRGPSLLAAALSVAGYATRWLTLDGTIAAAFVGGGVFAGSGWKGGLLLAIFFVSGSVLTQLNRSRGRASSESPQGARNARQVLANGLWAAIGAMLVPSRPAEGWAILTGGLAAAQADTWATELGVLNPTAPRMITDMRKHVERGTSGGISLSGTFASLLGASIIALPAVLLSPVGALNQTYFSLITVAGLAGSLFDSFLGATVQAMYFCPTDQKETEKHPLHTCGTPTVHIRGWEWLNND